jgi:eukaryotic-like serine/threonine-protein kinase
MTEREIFFEALEISTPEARAAYLEGVCAGDVALRGKVEELLKEHFSNDSLVAGPAVEGGRSEVESQQAPALMLDRYKLLEKIGEGGFGEVWMAEQREPIKRRVALKIIKPGMDSRQVVARFEAERQALAMMDHANIARVFDAGRTDSGRPYFVMELVRGIKITEYCDQNRLPTRERLNLFIAVCQAIQHAHQKGIIHRDIKPSNILVTLHDGVPVPKVIDFGIAKATQQELTDKTLFTQFQQFIGTPAYISPEQAEMSGLDIDTRADIYSLGVLLYELLVGQTPFDAKEMMQGGLDALRQIIREKEPLRPSTRLNTLQGDARTTAGKRRQTDVGKLVHQLEGDLDWIVMKCLEKDRSRRYETANGVAADIQRHLANEPVVARPPSRLYEFQKMVRRHKFGFAATGVVIVALAIGLGSAIWALAIEKHALARAVAAEREQSRLRQEAETARAKEAEMRRQAETQAARSAEVAKFMKDMLSGVAPGVAMGRDTTLLQEILDRTAERISLALTNQPEVEAELRLTLGLTYFELGEAAKSEAMQREALALFRKTFGNEHRKVVLALNNIAINLRDLGRDADAEVLLREALVTQRKLSGDADPLVSLLLNNLGNVLRGLGKLEEAETAHREALTLRRKFESGLVPLSLYDLALDLRRQGKLADAEAMLRNSLEIYKKDRAETRSRYTINVLNSLAEMLKDQRRLSEAESLAREGLAMGKRRLSDDHPGVINSTYILASVLCEEDRLAEAADLSGDLLAILEKRRPGDWQTFAIKSLLGNCLLRQTNYAQAEPLLVGGYQGLAQARTEIPAYRRYWVDDALKRLVRLYEITNQPEKAAEWKKLMKSDQAKAEK